MLRQGAQRLHVVLRQHAVEDVLLLERMASGQHASCSGVSGGSSLLTPQGFGVVRGLFTKRGANAVGHTSATHGPSLPLRPGLFTAAAAEVSECVHTNGRVGCGVCPQL